MVVTFVVFMELYPDTSDVKCILLIIPGSRTRLQTSPGKDTGKLCLGDLDRRFVPMNKRPMIPSLRQY